MHEKMSQKAKNSIGFTLKAVLSVLIVVCVAAQFGCSVAEPPKKRPDVYFPPSPAMPKMKWITTFRTQHDFPKTSSALMAEKFLGQMAAERFYKPSGVAADGNGRVFVADMDIHNVKIVDFNEYKIHMFKQDPWGKRLTGVYYDKRDRLYVVDNETGYIAVFNPKSRELLFSFGGRDYFEKPTFMAVNDELGRIYVSDTRGHKVEVFDLDGNHLFSFGEQGRGLGQLYAPLGIAVAPNGNVFVAEFLNTRIHVFDSDGKPIKHFGERGDKEHQFEGPRDLAFTSDGLLVVAEGRKAAIAIYDQEGNPLTFMGGKRSTHVLGFTLPTGVFVDSQDRIYVSDSMNMSVTIWQYFSPNYLRSHKIQDPVSLGRFGVEP